MSMLSLRSPGARSGLMVRVMLASLVAFLAFAYLDWPVPASASGWTVTSSMGIPRNGHVSATINGKIYVAGGHDPSRLASLEIYDPATNSWSYGPPMPSPRAYMAAAEVNGTMYVIGGNTDSETVSDVLAFNPAVGVWQYKAPMPTGRSGHTAAVIGGKIYVIGGVGSTGILQTVAVYDVATDTWTEAAPMPEPRDGPAVATLEGNIYVVGGCNTSCGYSATGMLASTIVYDPATDTWSSRASLPVARASSAAVALGGKLYLAGGLGNYSNHSSETDEYDPTTDTWTVRESMANVRQALTLNEVGGALYAIGGYNGSQYVGQVERLAPGEVPLDLTAVWEWTANGWGGSGGSGLAVVHHWGPSIFRWGWVDEDGTGWGVWTSEGSVAGQSVSIPSLNNPMTSSADWNGTASMDGSTITGTWTRGGQSGTFSAVRNAGAVQVLSDGISWKFSRSPLPGWETPAYDDSTWGTMQPDSGGLCGLSPGKMWAPNPVNQETIYVRRSVDLPDVPSSATLLFQFDDDGMIYINGTLVYVDDDNWSANPRAIDVARYLRSGENSIAIRADDVGGCQTVVFNLGAIFPDTDGDGVYDGPDNCPTTPNAGQENADSDRFGDDCDLCPTTATQWVVPFDDNPDCDGFPATTWQDGRGSESFIGTDPADSCPDNPADNAWPPDVNNNAWANLSDVVAYGTHFNKVMPDPAYSARFDLNASGAVNLSDIVLFGPFFNKSCTP